MFWKKSKSQKEVEVLTEILEKYITEAAYLRSYIGEEIGKLYEDECFNTEDVFPSEELKRRYWLKPGKTKNILAFGLLEKYFAIKQEEKNK